MGSLWASVAFCVTCFCAGSPACSAVIFTFPCFRFCDLKHYFVYTMCVYSCLYILNIDYHCFRPQNPVQEWGEETEDGAVYGVTLRREPVPSSTNGAEESPCSPFMQYRTCKVRRLKAATLERLVNHLLDFGCQEQDYGKIFLSTYRTFTSTTKLIELLFQRYGFLLQCLLGKCPLLV